MVCHEGGAEVSSYGMTGAGGPFQAEGGHGNGPGVKRKQGMFKRWEEIQSDKGRVKREQCGTGTLMEMLICDPLISCFPSPSPLSQGETDLHSSNSPRRNIV